MATDRKEHIKEYLFKTKDKRKEYTKEYYLKNIEKARLRDKKNYIKNKEKKKAYAKLPENRRSNTECIKKSRLKLKDGYIKRLLARKNGLIYKEIPDYLIELKRFEIKLIRFIKSQKLTINT